MASHPQRPRLRLPWLRTRFAAFVTGSRADRLSRAVPGYLLTTVLGWAITAFACYLPLNRWGAPVDRAVAVEAISGIAGADWPSQAEGLRVEKAADGLSLTILVTRPGEANPALQTVARVRVEAQASGSSLDKVVVTAAGDAGSDPTARMADIVLFERVPERPAFLFSQTHAVQLPASVHALQKALTAFLTGLAESRVVKAKKNLSLDTTLLEEQARAVGGQLKRFEQLGAEFNWNRRLNGKIQFLSVWAFWVAMLQMAARFWLHGVFERRVRHNPVLAGMWQDDRQALDDSTVATLSALCDFARDELREREIFGTRARSAYLDLYHAALAAFKVEGDYKSVPAFVDSQAATLGDERAAGMGYIKYLIWAIPSLGFVGTVVGIGDALLETVNVDSLDVGQAAIAKSMVSSNIGVAFDTTLVALLLSLVSMLFYHLPVLSATSCI